MLAILSRIRAPLGALLVIFALAGLAATGAGAAGLARLNRALAEQTEPVIARLQGLVGDAADALDAYQTALGKTIVTLDSLQAASASSAETLVIADDVLASVNGLLEDDLPAVLADTDTALDSAGRSAGVIDFVLKGLNTIARLTGVTYEPTLPLGEALDNVQASLKPMQQSLAGVAADLEAAREGLAPIRGDLQDISAGLADMSAALVEGQAALEGYDDLLGEAQTTLAAAAEQAPRLRARAVRVAAFALGWLAVTQAAVLYQGVQMLTYDPARVLARLAALEARV
ncbi:MAG: hypothetical protein HYZ26_05180 [Chloroflexi bacterium]|nr:hypothetical protein [Chloroflexota bacterium]